MKALTPPQSGKLGDLVASRNHFGYYLRRRPSVPPAPTPARNRSQAHLAAANTAWDSLSDSTRCGWNALARQRKTKSVLGRSGTLTGQTLFVKLNAAQAALGLPPVLEPPPLPQFGLSPVGELTIRRSRRRLILQLAVSTLPTVPIRLAATPPCNAGRSRCWDFRLLGLLPAPVNGQSDITALYVARYGWPPPGKRIFVETCPHLNGWQGLPLHTNALVPPEPHPVREKYAGNRPVIRRK